MFIWSCKEHQPVCSQKCMAKRWGRQRKRKEEKVGGWGWGRREGSQGSRRKVVVGREGGGRKEKKGGMRVTMLGRECIIVLLSLYLGYLLEVSTEVFHQYHNLSCTKLSLVWASRIVCSRWRMAQKTVVLLVIHVTQVSQSARKDRFVKITSLFLSLK